jgi:hypothetical protein
MICTRSKNTKINTVTTGFIKSHFLRAYSGSNYEAQKTITSIAKNGGAISTAFAVYDKLKKTRGPDVYVLTSLLNACQKCKFPLQGLPLIHDMKKITLNGVIIKVMASLCAETCHKDTALQLLTLMKKTDLSNASATDINMACTKLVVALCQEPKDVQYVKELLAL